jgi:hypothetical protein
MSTGGSATVYAPPGDILPSSVLGGSGAWVTIQPLSVLGYTVRLSPDVRQPVKTLLTVRWKILDRQDHSTSQSEAAGEAEAVLAGEQSAEE